MSAADDLLQLLRAAHNPVKSTAEPAETEEVSRLSRTRKRDDEHGTLKNKLREELLRKQAQAKESDPKGSWLRSFVHDTWKNTKKDSFAFERKRRLCYNLLRKRKFNDTDHGAAAAAAGTDHDEGDRKRLKYEDMFKDLPRGRGLSRASHKSRVRSRNCEMIGSTCVRLSDHCERSRRSPKTLGGDSAAQNFTFSVPTG